MPSARPSARVPSARPSARVPSARLALCAFMMNVWLCAGSRSSPDCGCHSRLRSVCLGPSDLVLVPCPDLDSERLSLNLFLNQTPVTSCHLPESRCGPAPSHAWANQSAPSHVTLTNHSQGLGFNVTVRDQTSHGLYVCKVQTKYPPPAQTKCGPERVLVLVQGHQCGLKMEPRPEQVPGLDLVWLVTVVCLSCYSLFTSVICLSLWVKSRGAEEENDYVNTKAPPRNKQRNKAKEIR